MRMSEMSGKELSQLLGNEKKRYEALKAKNLKLDMSRGKPGADQLDLSEGMLTAVGASGCCVDATGMDARNYGGLDGLPEAKTFFAEVFGVPEKQMILGGNSSLNMMYDLISKAYTHGMSEECGPWAKEEKIKFLCPSPGYDRHFAISEHFGMQLITVPMRADGPDMDIVEKLAADKSVKGIWCVPKYSNPEGKTYSEQVTRRMAALRPAAKDFRVIWDNAYAIHHLGDKHDQLPDILEQTAKAGNPELAYVFASTSKITFPGSGVAVMASGPANIAYMKKLMFYQTIGPDKINQLRHLRFFGDAAGVERHMKKQADIIRPKFEAVLEILDREIGGLGIAEWVRPRGGYFISVNLTDNCATRAVSLAGEAGVKMTEAGATFPYKVDPRDSNVRIAPTYPPVEELRVAMELFCICAKIAAAEKYLNVR